MLTVCVCERCVLCREQTVEQQAANLAAREQHVGQQAAKYSQVEQLLSALSSHVQQHLLTAEQVCRSSLSRGIGCSVLCCVLACCQSQNTAHR